eukprot:3070647-Amphidinium_carterae.1
MFGMEGLKTTQALQNELRRVRSHHRALLDFCGICHDTLLLADARLVHLVQQGCCLCLGGETCSLRVCSVLVGCPFLGRGVLLRHELLEARRCAGVHHNMD